MKKTVCRLLSFACLLGIPVSAMADTTVESMTMLRLFQDSRSGLPEKTLAPATQFLSIDADKLADGNLSLHLNGWGRVDLADKSYNNGQDGKDADGTLTYGYLKYRFNQANAQVRAGRFLITEGIVNERINGVSARTDLPMGFGISAFGGATVHTARLANEKTDGKGDGIYGGRVNYRYGGMLELGVSGLYETNAPNLTDPNHLTLAQQGKFGDHRLIGGDIWLAPHSMVQIMGHTSYNPETGSVAEHSYQLNIKPMKDLVLTGEFNEYNDRSFFLSSEMFSSMYNSLRDKSRITGALVSYSLSSQMELSADYHYYSREIGNANRMGADLRYRFKDNGVRTGASYHYLKAGSGFAIYPSSSDSASFNELRAYIMRDVKNYFASADAIAYIFDKKISGKQSAWEAIASVGYHFTPAIALSGDLSYGQSPEQDDDLKGLVRLTYNATYSSKGGK